MRDRLSPEERLHAGMTIEDACLALPGWRFQRVYAPADASRYHTWDFTARGDRKATLRLTFDNRRLILWGPPATDGLPPHPEPPTSPAPEASPAPAPEAPTA